MQKPMFLGLPLATSTTEMAPMIKPVRIIHSVFLFFTFFIPLLFSWGLRPIDFSAHFIPYLPKCIIFIFNISNGIYRFYQ